MERQNRGLSVGQLTVIFFGAVGLCAVFFALGYVTGANRRNPPSGPSVEQVPPASDIPAPINQPLDASQNSPSANSSASKSQSATIIVQNLPSRENRQEHAGAAGASRAGSQAARGRSAPGVVVQVAALRAESDAKSLVRILQSRGYHTLLVSPGEAGDALYRVQVGPFASRSDAVKSVQKLSRQGFRPFIKE
ncbi:MAG: SPOR domain-containing protein [Acidobacteriota bacterium]|nr:SPOR domain-containing protein [Acidobacteriota bacterium]